MYANERFSPLMCWCHVFDSPRLTVTLQLPFLNKQLLIEKPDNPIGFIVEYLMKKYPEKISGTMTVKSKKDSTLCTEMVSPVINTHQEIGEKSIQPDGLLPLAMSHQKESPPTGCSQDNHAKGTTVTICNNKKSAPVISEASSSLPGAILERNTMSIGEACPEESTPCELRIP